MRAFLFPGQGTQRVGMGQQLCHLYPEAAEVFERAGDVLGFDLARICREGPADELTNTRHAQPAVFTCSAAALAALTARDVEADLVAGHSVGEFTALMAAGALSFEDGLTAVQRRAELMASVTRLGTMTAVVGLEPAVVERICHQAGAHEDGAVVVVGLYNADRYVVLSGDVEAVRRAEAAVKEAGALKVLPLAVSHAFHSPLMGEVHERWAAFAQSIDLRVPRLPIALNTTGSLSCDVDEIRQALIDQVTSPVQWASCVRAMTAGGMTHAVEVGDSKVLATLGRNFDRAVTFVSMAGARSVDQLVTSSQGDSPRAVTSAVR
jgi:[acyl-carrier-protein] S-malonyltransferase